MKNVLYSRNYEVRRRLATIGMMKSNIRNKKPPGVLHPSIKK